MDYNKESDIEKKKHKFSDNDDKIFGFDKTYLVIFLVSFTQGIQGLSDLAVSYFYKDDLKLQPYEVSRVSSIASIPWVIKPIWGFISDSFPILGFRRKPYLVIFGFLISLSWISMSLLVDNISKALTMTFLISLSTAFCNVIGEALVVELSQKQKHDDPNSGAKNVSMFFMVKSIGSLLVAFSSGALLEYMDKKKIFLITSIFPLFIVMSAVILNEKRILNVKKNELKNSENPNNITNLNLNDNEKEKIKLKNSEYINSDSAYISSDTTNIEKDLNNNIESEKEENKESLMNQLRVFWSFLKTDKIYKPVIFIFLFMMTPSYSDAFFFFYTNVLKFNPMTIGRLKLVYGISNIIGIILYNNFFKHTSFKKIIIVTTILSGFFNLLSIILVERINLKYGIPDFMFCLATDSLTTALSEINFMPLLVLACNICPKNIEGTIYAFLMSIVNLGGLCSSQIGALLTSYLGITSTNFDNLKYLILISNLSLILPMPFLYLINDKDYIPTKPVEEEEKNGLIDTEIKTYLEDRRNQEINKSNTTYQRKSFEPKDNLKNRKNQLEPNNNERLSVKSLD